MGAGCEAGPPFLLTWSTGRRDDIELIGVAECLPVLGIRDLRDR